MKDCIKIELVQTCELEEQLKQCLEQRFMPDYFLYLGDSGSRNWLELDGSKEFTVASRLTGLLTQSIPIIARHIHHRCDMVSLGVGSGQKERLLLEALVPRGVKKYVAVDISASLVEKAMNRVADIGIIKIGLVALMEDLTRLRRFWGSPVLLCMLGNSFCNYEPEQLLQSIHRHLEAGDLFLFDCRLFPYGVEDGGAEREQVERMYRSQPNVRFNTAPLAQRGMGAEVCSFHLELETLESEVGPVLRTKKWLHLRKDARVSCGREQVLLRRGDDIQLGFTYKFTRPQVQAYLKRLGFRAVEICVGAEGGDMLALVQKGV